MARRSFFGLVSGVGLLAAGCGMPRRSPPNIVCVLVDQLRKDSFDAWATATARLAANGVVFHDMRSVAPWTYPSVISMMSGLLPQQHGADGFEDSRTLTTFALEVPLVHRLLKVAGWRTAAFVTNPFLREWNPFHIGFDTFSADFVKNLGNTRADFHEFGLPERMFAHSVNDEIRRHFGRTPPDKPEFTYVHYIDAHGPWEGAPFSPGYESAVRFVDERIAELYAFFRRRYREDVVFVVTSDHGRARGDDTHVGYGPRWRKMKQSVHDFNVRIPFVVLPGEWVARGKVVETPCCNVDFAPTVLDIAEVSSPLMLSGRSLVPQVRGHAPAGRDEERAIYLRVSAFGSCSDAIVHRGRKYMRFFDRRSGEVTKRRIFDLAADARETTSLGEDFGEAEALITEAAGTHDLRFDCTLEPMGPDLEEKLRALGYVD